MWKPSRRDVLAGAAAAVVFHALPAPVAARMALTSSWAEDVGDGFTLDCNVDVFDALPELTEADFAAS